MPLITLFVVVFVALAAIHALLSWSRGRAERARLVARWEEAGRPGDRESFVAEGLALYERSFRKRVLVLVYLVPLAALGLIVYLVNYA
ncbi:hypothetical protein [Wenxinia saemankumensis]|uniref:Cation/multidrug efflux pump n=1 Tax=Wenxinia saemankumensis TaxID=1447782 RepID=A0A1M6C1L6_9RHOB|nr:hypothetical protein [Wenxinia saemankumensis]SHI54890.1 hypothetical protein SAMN05444417_0958 [Wenxinia saemankumensis]